MVQIGNGRVRVDILQERMRQAMLERDDKSVFVRADGAVTIRISSRHGQAEGSRRREGRLMTDRESRW